jgi:hypothetical protein
MDKDTGSHEDLRTGIFPERQGVIKNKGKRYRESRGPKNRDIGW